ncbi:hypothetical protein GCM10011344_30580 [Dokdonia pacifica]|uniref:Lipocalin-like domain-containing protein n=1 Tax=Dokdonia pacifica TaxID=1627892 RepID=A0A239E960_9FLAO|nr:hypothetical protein [Dokdonia pacifica]GGG27651.1 hypothetical protein GCM10011344_30580 [Dokdonia pacifica]SNS41280.1 hypothetical protein SAMN06265376_11519 [Dokdonia pacifica]
MKRVHLIYLVIVTSLCACTQNPEEQLTYLNGYWEIAGVTTPDGKAKEFSLSQNIDFFEIQNNQKGIRKKVQPSINGNFTTSQSSENIDIEIRKDMLVLKYTTAFDHWEETVIEATKDELILLNENGNIYSYRRYEPILLSQ